jgi:hypothetical protein
MSQPVYVNAKGERIDKPEGAIAPLRGPAVMIPPRPIPDAPPKGYVPHFVKPTESTLRLLWRRAWPGLLAGALAGAAIQLFLWWRFLR